MISSKVCITTKSTLASLLYKGLATKQTAVKWTIALLIDLIFLFVSVFVLLFFIFVFVFVCFSRNVRKLANLSYHSLSCKPHWTVSSQPSSWLGTSSCLGLPRSHDEWRNRHDHSSWRRNDRPSSSGTGAECYPSLSISTKEIVTQ